LTGDKEHVLETADVILSMSESAGVSPCAYLLLTLLMYEKLEMLQSMIAHEDLSRWFTNQELLLTPAYTPLSLTHSNQSAAQTVTFKRGCTTAHLCM